MKSTDNTINNPIRKVELDATALQSDPMDVITLTQDEYDSISKHDPRCVYLIDDGSFQRMYVGDQRIPTINRSSMYFMAYNADKNKYCVYLNLVSNGHDNLCPVSVYDNADDALSALTTATLNGSFSSEVSSMRNILTMYRDRDLGVHECILGILTTQGWNNDPRFQILIEEANRYGIDDSAPDLPIEYKAMLHNIRYDNFMSSFDALYSDIYDIIVKYKWFENAEDHTINDALKEICQRLNLFTLL